MPVRIAISTSDDNKAITIKFSKTSIYNWTIISNLTNLFMH